MHKSGVSALEAAERQIVEALGSTEFRSLWRRMEQHWVSWEEFEGLTMPAGLAREQVWRIANTIRSHGAKDMPFPPYLVEDAGERLWYTSTTKLQESLRRISERSFRNSQLSCDLAKRAKSSAIARLMAPEMAAVLRQDGLCIDVERARKLAAHKPPPRTLEERVFLRFVESYENLPERIATRGLIELLCETLWEDGVERAEPLRPCGTFNRSVFTSDYVLDLVCEMHRGSDRATEGLHPVLQGMQFEITLQNHRPLPALNACVGFLLRAMYFRASNYPALEYLAFCEAVQRCREGTYDSGRFPRPILPDHDRIRSGAPGYDCTGDQEFILSVCEIELDRLERCMHSLVFHESVFEQALSTARELNGRQRSLLLDMIVNPYEETSIKDYRKRFSVAYSTGHDDLADLADRGYLVRIDQKRALTYLPGPRLAEVARKAIEGRNGNRSEELCSNGEVRP